MTYVVTTSSFKSQLMEQIKNKPFALLPDSIDCELLKKWLTTARHEVHQLEIDRLNDIVGVVTGMQGTGAPGITYKNVARIQDINDAYSSIVNMDYFPITVNQLPIVQGTRLTAEEFLTHIRKNINDFVHTNLAKFTPYEWPSYNEAALWNSSNPLGAVIEIDIAEYMGVSDDGSVIVSGYSPDKWTFTTIYDPKYGSHPVSGHRDFGYVENPNGSYTFYTRGVDRLTGFWGTQLQSLTGVPFEKRTLCGSLFRFL